MTREFEHSMKRRCYAHDYKGRSIYLITLEIAGRRPLLGRVRPEALALTRGAPNRPATEKIEPQGDVGRQASSYENRGAPNRPVTGENAAQFGGAAVTPLSASELSEIELKAINAKLFEPSELGRRVADEFMKIGEHVSGVKPIIAQPMPDHFHGILFVTRDINRSLGSIVAGFKGKCSQIAHALTRGAPNRPAAGENTARSGGAAVTPPLWEPGYHDRILTSEGQLEKMIRYVIDNPRRAAIRLCHRDLFTCVRRLNSHGQLFEAYGNGFLLQRPMIAQIQCSRRFFGFKRVEKLGKTPGATSRELKIARNSAGEMVVDFETPEFAAKRKALFEVAEDGAVLCSPCISDGEKAIAYAAVDAGHPLIVLRNEPFPARFKPSGRFFDACAEGRLLLLYPHALTRGAPNRPAAGEIEPQCVVSRKASSYENRGAPNRPAAGEIETRGDVDRQASSYGKRGAPNWPALEKIETRGDVGRQASSYENRGAPNRPATGENAARFGGAAVTPRRITRSECLALNSIVAKICGDEPSDIVYYGLVYR